MTNVNVTGSKNKREPCFGKRVKVWQCFGYTICTLCLRNILTVLKEVGQTRQILRITEASHTDTKGSS